MTNKLVSIETFPLVILILVMAIIACSVTTAEQSDVEASVAAAVAASRQAELSLQATVEAAIVATQQADQAAAEPDTSTGDVLPPPTPIPPTPAPDLAASPPPLSPEDVRAVIIDEVKSVERQDLARLKSLYTPDAAIIDHGGTPDDRSDDAIWKGWLKIEQRYSAFFSIGYSSIILLDLSIQIEGNRATGVYQGIIMDDILYEDTGVYTLEHIQGQWLITQLEFGNQPGYAGASPRDDGLYVLEIGEQHRYEEPWGWDRGDPCEAWRTNNFDDTKPDYRGFNVEVLLTNNSDEKFPDEWPISFKTAKGKSVKACQYGYEGAGPPPETISSATFFTVVEKGDYVEIITLSYNGQVVMLFLDGKGGWSRH